MNQTWVLPGVCLGVVSVVKGFNGKLDEQAEIDAQIPGTLMDEEKCKKSYS